MLKELGEESSDPIGWNSYFEEFYSEDKGISLLSRYDGKILNSGFSSIECDTDMVNMLGITKDMDFSEIQKQLEPTEVVRIDNGLEALASYELRYIINGVRLKFVSGDENGSERFRLKFVKHFDIENEFRRITIGDIKILFSLSKTELKNAISPELILYREKNYVSLNGISFSFIGEKLESIGLGEIYELEGIRLFDEIEEVPGVLGKKKLVFYSSEEGDSFYELEYSYGDIRVVFWALDYNHRIDYIQIYDVNLKVFQ